MAWFYDNSILLGTKMLDEENVMFSVFYDNSILLGTKMMNVKEINKT